MNVDEITKLVAKIVQEMQPPHLQTSGTSADGMIEVPDITAVDFSREMDVPHPYNEKMLRDMMQSTPARIGVWRAGPRYKTRTALRFRADHAAAMDAVFTEVPQEFLDQMGLPTIQTLCHDKDEYLTRPDLGKQFSDENTALMRSMNATPPQVLICVADGLSSTAIEANVADMLPVIQHGLTASGITVGKPFFIKYGRVPSMDAVSEATKADVVCLLVGERPGLVTAESMSAYIAYKATVDMPEARRNVISNIHGQGTSAVEAGAYAVDLIKLMLKNQASGLDLKL